LEISDYKSFAEACVEELKILQDKFQNDYDVDWYDNWFYNQSTGLLTFSTDDQELNFKYFAVGSFSEKSNTWKWSWDNDSTLDIVKEKANIVKKFGQRFNFSKLTTGYFDSDEFEAWEFVAIASKLANGIGVYRPVNDRQLKMFFVVTEFIDNASAKESKTNMCNVRRTNTAGQHLSAGISTTKLKLDFRKLLKRWRIWNYQTMMTFRHGVTNVKL
jgi:hypothetical protein